MCKECASGKNSHRESDASDLCGCNTTTGALTLEDHRGSPVNVSSKLQNQIKHKAYTQMKRCMTMDVLDVLDICITHLVVVMKQTSVGELLDLRQTCKHLRDFVGDFLTTLNFAMEDSHALVDHWDYNDADELIYSPSLPSEFLLRRIKKVVFGGRSPPQKLGFALSTAARRFDWNIEVVEVRLVDRDVDEDDYQTAHCSEVASAFLEQLHTLSSLTIGTSRWDADNELLTPVSFVDVSGVRLLMNCAATVPGLRSLNLHGVVDLDGVIPALVAAPSSLWATLREMQISYGEVDEVLGAAFPHCTQLRTLNLISCTIGDQASDASALHELRVLNIAECYFASVKSQPSFLRAMQHCVLLEELCVDVVERINGQALLELLESLHHLRMLAVGSIGSIDIICSEKIARIVVDWPQLEMLFLEGIFETDGIGAALILGGATRLSRLRVLSTTWSDNTCVEALLGGNASWLDTVEELQLEKPGYYGSEGCASALINRAARLRSLKYLGTRGFEDALVEIQRAMPTVEVDPWFRDRSRYFRVSECFCTV